MSTYLVTGAAGFIASRVCEMLLAEGHTVVGIDNLNDYYDVRLKEYRLSKLLGWSYSLSEDQKSSVFATHQQSITNHAGRFTFRHLDIENPAGLDEVFQTHRIDAVFNLAARAGVRASLAQPELYQRTNVLGEENVLKCQVKYGVRKHVLASSSSVYAGCPMPFTEDAPLGMMQSPYAGTKHAAELLAREYHDRHGLDVAVLRYFTVFGPAGRPDMAPFRFIKWIAEGTPITLYGDGTQARDFTYIDDIARGTILAGQLPGGRLPGSKPEGGDSKPVNSEPARGTGLASGDQPAFEIVNLGGGNNPVSLHRIIGWIEQALTARRADGEAQSSARVSPASPVRAKISTHPSSAADMSATWADITKAERLLGWKPRVTPEEGFRLTVDWYLANRGWLKDIRT